MATLRNVISEACERANLANRKQGAPAELTEAAFLRLSGILREYSDNSLITAYRGEADFLGNAEKIEIGGVDIPCGGNITDIKALYYKSQESIDWMPMNFLSLERFYDAANMDITYSWQPKGANLFTLYLKPRFVAQNRQLKLIYNQDIKLGLDDDISLPHVYVELLIRALAYKMSVDRPRASDTKRLELQRELEALEEQIKANNSDNRILTRQAQPIRQMTLGMLESGSFIFGR